MGVYKFSGYFFYGMLFTLIFTSCKDTQLSPQVNVTDNFESGSIGAVNQIDDNTWEMSIANDNNDASLPDSWRSWWYLKMENVSTREVTEITIKNSGWPYYYVPVYSYDCQTWYHFREEDVIQKNEYEITIQNHFEESTVWIARFYPYTFSDLENYLNTLKNYAFVDIQIPGYSQEGKPVYQLKITDNSVPVSGKKRIFIHARTHPAETPPSFLLEGMINFLVSGSGEAADLLAQFEFYIFPMQNVDGVIAGNYRSTPKSENLEMMWYRDSLNPLVLTSDAPSEVTIIHKLASELMSDGGPVVSVALNLHASNSEPDVCPFFYPHFGPASGGYVPKEVSLWNRQLNFIYNVISNYGNNLIEPITQEGGSSFADKTYPESWWWNNFKDSVMAMTFEMTYGRAGYAPNWVEPDNYRELGVALLLGIRDFCNTQKTIPAVWEKAGNYKTLRRLKYPELYLPANENASKE